MLTTKETADIVKKFGKDKNDTGSYEVQIALLTADIQKLNAHFKENKKDKFSFRGFIAKIERRKMFLKKLQSVDLERYKIIIKELKLRK